MTSKAVVGNWAQGTYQTDGRRTSWLKVKNPDYSQMRDRHELFDARGTSARRVKLSKRPYLVLR